MEFLREFLLKFPRIKISNEMKSKRLFQTERSRQNFLREILISIPSQMKLEIRILIIVNDHENYRIAICNFLVQTSTKFPRGNKQLMHFIDLKCCIAKINSRNSCIGKTYT